MASLMLEEESHGSKGRRDSLGRIERKMIQDPKGVKYMFSRKNKDLYSILFTTVLEQNHLLNTEVNKIFPKRIGLSRAWYLVPLKILFLKALVMWKCWRCSVEGEPGHKPADEFDPNYKGIFLKDAVVMISP